MSVAETFAAAERALKGGDPAQSVALLDRLPVTAASDPSVLHMRAIALRGCGRLAEARRAFERASQGAPGNPQLANNFANLLRQVGEPDAALACYDRALAIDPRYRDARFNRALLLQAAGRLEEALADLDLLATGQAEARVASARGAVLHLLGRSDEAAAAYDQALAADPNRVNALYGRARVAMERGEDEAVSFYRRALAQRPGDRDVALGLAEALEAAGNPEGLNLLSDTVRRHPDWIAGHEALARMRSEAGEPDRFADHYQASLAVRPDDRALHYSYWQSLARGQRHGDALAALQASRGRLADDAAMLLMEAVFVSESGDPKSALTLLDKAGAIEGSDFARGRIALRSGDSEMAAASFERVVAGDVGSINGWANLDLAWRLLGDPRHEWLSGQAGLHSIIDLGLGDALLAELADILRGFHRTRSHPIGQSLRGGTQTRGPLLTRKDPVLVRLRGAILDAISEHLAGMPPVDPTHPLLRHRDASLEITGSWSVRLTGQGFHVNHIHPQGILSSACYISLPPTLGDDATRDGWLELGRPPAELGLDLAPLASVEPRPGRIALFPSYLFHGTRPFRDGERLTVAFDVVPA